MRRTTLLALFLALFGCDSSAPLDGSVPGSDAPRIPVVDAPSDAPRPDTGPLVLGAHPRILVGERSDVRTRLTAALSSTTGTRFRNMVDRELSEGGTYAFRQSDAALMGVLTGEARYCAHAVAETETFVASEEALIASGERPQVAFDSYLEVGDRIGDLALVYDWCFDDVTPAQRARWIAYANQAVWNVWNYEDAEWNGASLPWSGWSINNPSNNYYYSFLEATMMLGLATDSGPAGEENPMASEWLVQFRSTKIEAELAVVFNRDLTGGGSREGTGYGTAMRRLFWLYDVWEESTGERIADLTEHTHASIPYLLHATTPTLDRLAPIGDHARDSTAALFDYHRDYLLKLIDLFPADPVAASAVSYLDASSVPEVGQGFEFLYDFLYDPQVTAAPLDRLGLVYHGVGTGHVFARSGWTSDASYLAFIAGPYTESHAHQDQGSFVLFRGEWLAFDENVLSHSGIVQGVEVHNLVRLVRDGEPLPMREGTTSELRAVATDGDIVYLSADTAAAYRDDDVTQVLRRMVYLRPGMVVIDDRIATSDTGITPTFGLNTPLDPSISGARATMTGGEATLDLFVLAGGTTLTETSWNSVDGAEYSGGFRVDVASSSTGTAHFVTVLGIDGAVTSATSVSAGGVTTVTLGGGVTVAFPDDGSAPTVTTVSRTVTFDDAIEPQPLLAP